LFTKEQTHPTFSNYFAYYLSPVFRLFLSLIIWSLLPYLTNLINFRLGALFFLACTSLGVYTVMVAG
jgi:NADH-ubiquinone oxidoreductase chain 1